jgi:hypothetical protein
MDSLTRIEQQADRIEASLGIRKDSARHTRGSTMITVISAAAIALLVLHEVFQHLFFN